MSAIEELAVGGFYRCTAPGGEDPVRIWVGRIDLERDLGARAVEPVVSLIVKSMEEDMPTISHAPFGLDAVLDGLPEAMEPFDIAGVSFAVSYDNWRRDWDAGRAGAWDVSPAEAYAGMLEAMRKGIGR